MPYSLLQLSEVMRRGAEAVQTPGIQALALAFAARIFYCGSLCSGSGSGSGCCRCGGSSVH